MSIERKQYSGSFKAKVALAALREERTLAQLSSKYGVNANMISKWKLQALQNMAQLFDQKSCVKDIASADDIKNLRAKIGQLTIERDFLEHASDQLGFGGFKNDTAQIHRVKYTCTMSVVEHTSIQLLLPG